MTYHINPETGRPNLCRASIRDCRYGENSKHFDTKQEAQTYSENQLTEEFGQVSTLKKDSENSTRPKSLDTISKELGVLPADKLHPLIKKRLRLSMTSKETENFLEKSGGYDQVSFYVYYNANQEVALNYDNPATIKTFTKGACAILASELNRVTNLPLAVFTAKSKDPEASWNGHVAVKLPSGEYFDINGNSSRSEVLAPFSGDTKSWTEKEVSHEEFKEIMGVHKDKEPTDALEPLEKAVLANICLDLIKDYNLNEKQNS